MDKRIQRTRTALSDALMSLMTVRGYGALSVDALLERAQVARSTFYAHFKGKDDLLRENLKRLHTLAVGDEAGLTPVQRVLRFNRAFYEHAFEQRSLHLSLLRDHDRGASVFRKIKSVLAEIIAEDLREAGGARDRDFLEYAVHFIVGAQWEVLTWWLERKPGMAPGVIHARFETLVSPVLHQITSGPAFDPEQ